MSRFVAPFRNFFLKATDAPLEYGEAAAIMILSGIAIGRRELDYGQGIKPNLFLMLVGDSSVARKSTSVNFAKKFLQEVDEARIGPRDYTVEGLIRWMQEKDPVTKKTRNKVALFAEEFGADLARMDAYAATMATDFCALYDGETFEKVRAKTGIIKVENPRVSLFAAAAYPMLIRYIKPRDWMNGYMMRFLFVAPMTMRPAQPVQPQFPHPEYQTAVTALKVLRDDVRASATGWKPQLDPQAYAYYVQVMVAFNQQVQTLGHVPQTYQARFGTNLLKLAMLYQLDIDPFSNVTLLALQSALHFALTSCWSSFTETYNRTAMGEFESLFYSVFQTLRAAGPISRYELAQRYWGNELLDRVVTYMRTHGIAMTVKAAGGSEQIALTETWRMLYASAGQQHSAYQQH